MSGLREVGCWRRWALVALFSLGSHVAHAYPVAENFEGGLAGWSAQGLWDITTSNVYSPPNAVADSPGRFYANNTDASLTRTAGINLTGAVRPVFKYMHRHLLEENYDVGWVEVSTNAGATWTVLKTHTGTKPSWGREQLDLAAYVGQASLRVRFRMTTDASVVMEGWTLDDVYIGEAPLPATGLAAAALSPNRVALSWIPSASPGVVSQVLLRSRTPGAPWESFHVVATLGATATTHEDFSVAPKTTYAYRVMALDGNALHALTPEKTATTPAGMDYPAYDNGEAGPMIWTPEGTWALSDEDAFSPSFAWSDSPGTNYANNVNSAITLAAPLNLSGAMNPELSFVHRYAFLSGDSGNVEVSGNNGTEWTLLGQFSNASSAGWVRQRYSLSAYTGASQVLVRFRLTSNSSGVSDGWHIDDLGIAERPSAIPAPILSDVTSHSIRISWTQNADSVFSHYAIFRSPQNSVGLNSTLVAEIFSQSTTSFVDSGLPMDTEFFYRVYAVSPYGTYSADGAASNARTLNNPLPFSESFEGGVLAWQFSGTWGLQTNHPFAGSYCMADSVGAFYAPSTDTYAQTSVDLSNATWPVLTFHDRYDISTGDWMRLEISPNGSTWTPMYGLHGPATRPEWRQQQIDLSPWKGQNNVRIRFRVVTDGDPATTADGWNIDEVTVAEHVAPDIVPPFLERFEGTLNHWLLAAWRVDTNDVYEGSSALVDGTHDRIGPDVSHHATLAGVLDLTGMTLPQVTLWARARLTSYSYFRVYVSNNGGVSWGELGPLNIDSTVDTPWTRLQASLAAYAGQKIRIRVSAIGNSWAPSSTMRFDKFTIEEAPENVTFEPIVPGLKSATLTWQPTTMGSAFQRYEIRRSTAANVPTSAPLVATITNPNTTTVTDTGLIIGQTYFYRLFVVNQNDTYSTGSERSTTTVPRIIGFTDPMESLDNWDATGAWGTETGNPHQGSSSVTESPNGNYEHSKDTYIQTSVDLATASWPVLTFWDRYDISTGDWMRLEISPNGSSWTPMYGLHGPATRPEWRQQQIDLSPWKGQNNVRIRFRVLTDGDPATTADGWNIDEVTVAEHVAPDIVPPFLERFEGTLNHWLLAAWRVDTNDVYEGSSALVDGTHDRIGPDVSHHATLAGVLDLTGMTLPQVTLWARARLTSYSYFRVYVSNNGGVSWGELGPLNIDSTVDTPWTRLQASLAAYAGQKIRIRVSAIGNSWAPSSTMRFDKFTIEEAPENVTFNPIVPGLKSATLTWQPTTMGSAFQRYEIRRSAAANVSTTATLIAQISNPATTVFTDTSLVMGTVYYYRLFVVNTNDTYSLGEERVVLGARPSVGFVDPMETMAYWDPTGIWGVDTSNPLSGSSAISDSPGGNYAPSTDTWLLTSFDLTGSTWPVLTFSDRLDIGLGDWARLEVSPNGSTWTMLYGVHGYSTQPQWTQHKIDLSPWKGETNLRVRFRVGTDGSAATTGDGWAIDDVSLTEQPLESFPYPFYENAENGMGNWLNSSWTVSTSQSSAGSASFVDGVYNRIGPDCQHLLVAAREIDLTTAVSPKLTYWAKVWLNSYSHFRADISSNGGVSWTELGSVNVDSTVNTPWTRYQVSLAPYVGQKIRLRFRLIANSWAPETRVFLDSIGIGEENPDAPALLSPADFQSVLALRPHLTVENAIDPQSDPLNYQFEVYSDAALTQLIAAVPAVASGEETTTWQVDINLPNNQQYWWRARASDGTRYGPWTAAWTFYINHVNAPPYQVVIAGPPADSILPNLTYSLSWYPTVDPDVGDVPEAYHVQIARDAFFTQLIVDRNAITLPALSPPQDGLAHTLALSTLPGAANLQNDTVYHWRVRARDQWDAWSPWSAGPVWFIFGHPVPNVQTATMVMGAEPEIRMAWRRSGRPSRVYFSPTLNPPAWRLVEGPDYGTNAVIRVQANEPIGFYRIESDDE